MWFTTWGVTVHGVIHWSSCAHTTTLTRISVSTFTPCASHFEMDCLQWKSRTAAAILLCLNRHRFTAAYLRVIAEREKTHWSGVFQPHAAAAGHCNGSLLGHSGFSVYPYDAEATEGGGREMTQAPCHDTESCGETHSALFHSTGVGTVAWV